MFSESFWISVISAIVGPTLVLYIANRLKNKKTGGDRLDVAIGMYEKIIKRQDEENKQLRIEINELKAQLRER